MTFVKINYESNLVNEMSLDVSVPNYPDIILDTFRLIIKFLRFFFFLHMTLVKETNDLFEFRYLGA